MELIIFITLFIIGLVFGKYNEKRHFSRLEKAEKELSHIKVLNIKTLPLNLDVGGILVTGNVVIAIDYFKMVMAALRIFLGGRLNSYSSLIERARREAVIRMQRSADKMGADAIYNTRLEFSAVGQGAELLAYGTAVKLKTSPKSGIINHG